MINETIQLANNSGIEVVNGSIISPYSLYGNPNLYFGNAESRLTIHSQGKLSLEVFGNSLFHGWTISYTEILMLVMIFGLIGWCIYLTIKLHKNIEGVNNAK